MWSETRVDLRSLQSQRLHTKEAQVIPGPAGATVTEPSEGHKRVVLRVTELLSVARDSAHGGDPRSVERSRTSLDHILGALES